LPNKGNAKNTKKEITMNKKYQILVQEYHSGNAFYVHGIYDSKKEAVIAWNELFDNAQTGQIWDAKITEMKG